MSKTHHFILVHGAYHQPQHWEPLVKVLQQSGHRTSTPRLPSVSAIPIPDCLAADISAIKTAVLDAIASGSESVVPIFHSYGGIPGFEALATLTDEEKSKIPKVVCISAFIVPKGDSLVSVQKPDSRNYVEIDVGTLYFRFTSLHTSTTNLPAKSKTPPKGMLTLSNTGPHSNRPQPNPDLLQRRRPRRRLSRRVSAPPTRPRSLLHSHATRRLCRFPRHVRAVPKRRSAHRVVPAFSDRGVSFAGGQKGWAGGGAGCGDGERA